ncbi:MAG: iron-sulfur cluster assembly scaffold protein [Vicinamibacterales bacterium]
MCRRRAPALPIAGGLRYDDCGRFARFSVRVNDGVISDVTFDASMCVTLVAYCEVAAEWVTGLAIPAAARRVRPLDLMGALPLVPPDKRERALLAAQALMATVIESAKEQRG